MKYKPLRNHKERKRIAAYRNADLIPFNSHHYPYIPYGKPNGGLENLILELIIASGEIPTDIYIQLNICHGTFRSIISALYKKKLIKRNISDTLHTYLLSAHGKNTLSKYAPFIKTSNNVSSRKRHIKLARLNAYWIGLSVTVSIPKEQSAKDLILSSFYDELCFINSYILKNSVTDYPEQIKRSKAYGLLTVFDHQYMIYYEPAAVDFYFEEELFCQDISKFTGKDIKDMILIVDSLLQAAYWIYFMLDHFEWFYGDSLTKLFHSVKLLVMDSYAEESFYVLTEEKKIENDLKEMYPFLNKIDDDIEHHLFLSLDYGKLQYLLARAKYNPDKKIIIITSPYLFELIKFFANETKIEVLSIKEDVWNNLF